MIARAVLALAVLLLATPTLVSAQASLLPAETLDQIRADCTSTQINLQQLQKRDAVSRINRGRAYDQMLRQVSAFNSRLAYNKVDAPQFVQLTGDLQQAVDDFRSTFTRYDDGITSAIRVNCKDKIEQFYDAIVTARNERNTLGQQVNHITELSNNYRTELVQYQQTLPKEGEGQQ